MKKSILAVALMAVSGSVFAFGAGSPSSVQSEGVELRASQVIPQVCQITGINGEGSGIGFADTGFSGTPASITVYSNVQGGTGLDVSFSNTDIALDGVNGYTHLPEISNKMSDDYLWVAKTDLHAQGFSSEGQVQSVGFIDNMGETVIEFYPELRKNKSEMPAGEIHASATVTVTCNAL